MQIERIWTANAYANFCYLIGCETSGEALAIDPIEPEMCQQRAAARGWRITQIANTHEHGDHNAGNARMQELSGAPILAPAKATAKIPNVDRTLAEGDVVEVGGGRLEVFDTPGHTMSHISLLWRGRPALFCGDTLFNAGVGNCHSGDPRVLYHSVHDKLAGLPDETEIHAGHDYLANNLRFTLDREPGNAAAKALLAQVGDKAGAESPVTTLGEERQINVFLRLEEPGVVETLAGEGADTSSPEAVFLALRERRNSW